jgi:hypothetical protein
MINIVTVHWMSDKWISPQLRYVERFVNAPYRVYASLNGIDDPAAFKKFHFAADVPGEHWEKLDTLAKHVVDDADPSDILIFLDGDAFPIQGLQPWLDDMLLEYPLVAVQRAENCDDMRAHPCFCATTVGFWNNSGCDWTPAPWRGATGTSFMDAGGTLANLLDANDVKWLPLRRTNTRDIHPLWFGVYGHRLYHHGAGFRQRSSRVDDATRRAAYKVAYGDHSLGQLSSHVRYQPSVLLKARPRHAQKLVAGARKTLYNRMSKRFENKASDQADQIFEELLSDDGFYRQFDSTVP